jgi:hypothetical protein
MSTIKIWSLDKILPQAIPHFRYAKILHRGMAAAKRCPNIKYPRPMDYRGLFIIVCKKDCKQNVV